MKHIGWRIAAALAGGLVLIAGLAMVFAPYVAAELFLLTDGHVITDPGPAKIAKGRMVDDYFVVQDLGDGVFAIGEPRYYQQNYAYLITGRTRALLFDSGSGTRNISGVVASLTHLPVTVMVSHLHFDHLGGIAPFRHVAMIDLPQTRVDVKDGVFTPKRYEWLGQGDRLPAPSLPVTDWLKPGSTIDLGGRVLTLMSTPGHTPTSATLYDPAGKRLFVGDFVYPGHLYAFLPGASLSAYHQTTRRLLADIPADTTLWTAHCCRKEAAAAAAPWLSMKDLRDLDQALSAVEQGKAQATGFYPRIYPVNGEMTLAAGFPWTNR